VFNNNKKETKKMKLEEKLKVMANHEITIIAHSGRYKINKYDYKLALSDKDHPDYEIPEIHGKCRLDDDYISSIETIDNFISVVNSIFQDLESLIENEKILPLTYEICLTRYTISRGIEAELTYCAEDERWKTDNENATPFFSLDEAQNTYDILLESKLSIDEFCYGKYDITLELTTSNYKELSRNMIGFKDEN
jgi:hypothetical protein